MSNRRMEMYQYRQIIVRMRQGESNRAIVRSKLAGRHKLRDIRVIANAQGWLGSAYPLPDDATLSLAFKEIVEPEAHKSQVSKAKPFESEIKAWLCQGITSIVIYNTLVRKHSFKGSYDCVQRFVYRIKQEGLIKNASCVLEFGPGEAAQVDFGKGLDITDEGTGEIKSTWIFVMTLCFSRHQYAELIHHQDVETWLACHRHAFEFFGGVPVKIIIDNCKCAITKACYYDPEVQRAYAECAEGYGFMISPCPPREPKKKGRVEAGVKYAKMNFFPLRDIKSLADGNTQLLRWILEEAGNRIHGTTGLKPLTAFTETEKHLLKPLPDNPPELASWIKLKVHGDCHVQHKKNRYSVPYQFIHQALWLRMSETTVRIYKEHEQITLHPRLKGTGLRSTKMEHMPPNAQAYLMGDPTWCKEQAHEVGAHCLRLIEALFTDRVLDHLRAAQGIVGLGKKFGKVRLNNACARALKFNSLKYKTVKRILDQGLDYELIPSERAFDLLGTPYTKGKYCRAVHTLH